MFVFGGYDIQYSKFCCRSAWVPDAACLRNFSAVDCWPDMPKIPHESASSQHFTGFPPACTSQQKVSCHKFPPNKNICLNFIFEGVAVFQCEKHTQWHQRYRKNHTTSNASGSSREGEGHVEDGRFEGRWIPKVGLFLSKWKSHLSIWMQQKD